MSVFEEHTERLQAEYLATMFESVIKEQKRRAMHLSEKEYQRWWKSPRHRLHLWLKKLAEKLYTDPPDPVDWRKLNW